MISHIPQGEDFVASITLEESFSYINIKPKPKQQEEVYMADNPEMALEKLKQFCDLHDKERLVYSNHLAELLELIGERAFLNTAQILDQIYSDSYTIQFAVMKQMHQIINLFKRRISGYQEIKQHIIPFLNRFLHHHDTEMKTLVGFELNMLAPFLTEQDRVDLILHKIIDLAHDQTQTTNIILAAQMFGTISQIIGQGFCEKYICPEIFMMGKHSNEQIREVAIEQLSKICVASSQIFVEKKLIPFFQQLCLENVTSIRVSCIRVLPNLSKYSQHNVKTNLLSPIFMKLLRDTDRIVKKIAYQTLGQFINTIKFGQDDQNLCQSFFLYYLNMVEEDVTDLSKDPQEMLQSCSFFFPAVLQSFGKQYWNRLEPLYNQLLSNTYEGVRRPLAYSFHEIAKILGPEMAQEKLIDKFHILLTDPVQDIRNGIIRNLAKFISIFDVEERELTIDLLLAAQKDYARWRSRQEICVQVLNLCQCFNPDTVFQVIAPIIFKMCSDPVAEVRKKAAKNVPHLLEAFKIGSTERNVLEQNMRAFSKSKRFIQRQAFALMCYKLFEQSKYFQTTFLESFQDICSDKIMVVRICALKTLDRYIMKHELKKDNKYLQRILLTFKGDPGREIQEIMSKYSFIINKPRKASQRSNKSNKSGSSNGNTRNASESFEDLIKSKDN